MHTTPIPRPVSPDIYHATRSTLLPRAACILPFLKFLRRSPGRRAPLYHALHTGEFTMRIKAFLLPVILTTLATASVPHVISYQGVLTDSAGNPFPDGSYEVGFALYTDSTSTAAADSVWGETKMLAARNGMVFTMLGDQNPLIPNNFEQPLWLALSVDGAALARRARLGAVGYSLRAAVADSAVAAKRASNADFANTASHSITSDSALHMKAEGIIGPVKNCDYAGKADTATLAFRLESARIETDFMHVDTTLSTRRIANINKRAPLQESSKYLFTEYYRFGNVDTFTLASVPVDNWWAYAGEITIWGRDSDAQRFIYKELFNFENKRGVLKGALLDIGNKKGFVLSYTQENSSEGDKLVIAGKFTEIVNSIHVKMEFMRNH